MPGCVSLRGCGVGESPWEFVDLLGRSTVVRSVGGFNLHSAPPLPPFFPFPAGSLPVSRVESVPGFQMHSEDFPALPGTSKANGKLWLI